MSTDLGPWHTAEAAAPLLGISVRQVQLLCEMGELRHKREGRRILIPERAIAAHNETAVRRAS